MIYTLIIGFAFLCITVSPLLCDQSSFMITKEAFKRIKIYYCVGNKALKISFRGKVVLNFELFKGFSKYIISDSKVLESKNHRFIKKENMMSLFTSAFIIQTDSKNIKVDSKVMKL